MQSGKSLDNRTRQSWDTETEFGFRSQVQSFAVCVSACSVASCVQLFLILWMLTCQAPLLMGFSREKYWNRLPYPPPGNLPNPGLEAASPALQADSSPLSQWGKSLYRVPEEDQ